MQRQKVETRRRRLLPLSGIVALGTAVVIAGAMAIYALWQYQTHPGTRLVDLFYQHLWHVLVLGGVIHGALWFGFERLFARPLKIIYLHLYEVGGGRFRPLELQTVVRELQTVIEGINLMIWRMNKVADDESSRGIRNNLAALDRIADDLRADREEISEAIVLQLKAIEEELNRRDVERSAAVEKP